VDELSEFLFRGFSELRLLATDQGHGERSCPYDLKRNGLVLGEGAGILAIETEGHARSRRARIYGYILGYRLVGGSSQKNGAEDIKRSVIIGLNGRKRHSIDYISGAGNSSQALDALEAQGVKKKFLSQSPHIHVSSIKSMIGEAIALGGLRMVANVLSMECGFIPPTINYLTPDPTCDLSYVFNQRLDEEIRSILHLGISPGECYSSILMGAEWNP
jgi:3-oxoacyl-[acyl-carrier-protein] synthase II